MREGSTGPARKPTPWRIVDLQAIGHRVILAAQYKAAPQVTRKRLYLETMQQVLQGTTKIVADGGSSRILMMPIQPASQGVVTLPDYSTAPAAAAVVAPEPAPAPARSTRPERRGRGEDKQ